jgi:hypothetical protein
LSSHPAEFKPKRFKRNIPISAQLEKSKRRSYNLESKGIPTFREFAEIYVREYFTVHNNEITILYPGSGGDLAPLHMASKIMEEAEEIERIRLIYTEIGGVEVFDKNITDISWHDGLSNIIEQIKTGVKEYELDDVIEIISIKKLENSEWIRRDIPGSSIVEFSMTMRVGSEKKLKNIVLLLCYNIFENRRDFSAKERTIFDEAYLKEVRKGYWHPDPRYKLKIYPTYFIQEQFDLADILLSNSPGNPPLLIFDYIRALAKSSAQTPKTFLIDWGWDEKFELSRIVSEEFDFTIEKKGLRNNRYGDCRTEPCKPKIIHVFKNH